MILVDLAQGFGIGGVYRRNDGEVVLEFEKVAVCEGDCVVERVCEGRIERAEGELVDVVAEVEGYNAQSSFVSNFKLVGEVLGD